EQIDRDEPVGEFADHLVAAAADRGQLAIVVKQAERLDGRHRVALALQEQAVEAGRGLVLDLARDVGVRMRQQRRLHDVEGVAEAALERVEMRQTVVRVSSAAITSLRDISPTDDSSSISRRRPCAAARRSLEVTAERYSFSASSLQPSPSARRPRSTSIDGFMSGVTPIVSNSFSSRVAPV